jgi:hypothetical protein
MMCEQEWYLQHKAPKVSKEELIIEVLGTMLIAIVLWSMAR